MGTKCKFSVNLPTCWHFTMFKLYFTLLVFKLYDNNLFKWILFDQDFVHIRARWGLLTLCIIFFDLIWFEFTKKEKTTYCFHHGRTNKEDWHLMFSKKSMIQQPCMFFREKLKHSTSFKHFFNLIHAFWLKWLERSRVLKSYSENVIQGVLHPK